MEEWISRADMALYRAKAAGRNQVKVENIEGNLEDFIGSTVRSARLQWSKNYECGHATIDQQHRDLFASLNRLLQLGEDETDQMKIQKEIIKLLNGTVKHFQYEEQILFQTAHSEAKHHAEAHRQLLQRASQLINQYEDERVNLAALLHFMIYELTAQHIMIDDKRFGAIGDSPAPTPEA
jgi:hemerythrin-like metal-binding protein